MLSVKHTFILHLAIHSLNNLSRHYLWVLPLFDQAITALWASQTWQAGEMRCWLVIPELTITLSRTFSLLCETLASVVSDVRCRVVVSNFARLCLDVPPHLLLVATVSMLALLSLLRLTALRPRPVSRLCRVWGNKKTRYNIPDITIFYSRITISV